jgi:hypothetical protein
VAVCQARKLERSLSTLGGKVVVKVLAVDSDELPDPGYASLMHRRATQKAGSTDPGTDMLVLLHNNDRSLTVQCSDWIDTSQDTASFTLQPDGRSIRTTPTPTAIQQRIRVLLDPAAADADEAQAAAGDDEHAPAADAAGAAADSSGGESSEDSSDSDSEDSLS